MIPIPGEEEGDVRYCMVLHIMKLREHTRVIRCFLFIMIVAITSMCILYDTVWDQQDQEDILILYRCIV